MLRNIHRLLYSFWCLECLKWHFRASRFKNFLGGMPPDPLEARALRPLNCNSRLLLYYHPPTSNFIENPVAQKGKSRVVRSPTGNVLGAAAKI